MIKSDYSEERYVHANADIMLRTWYTGKTAIPYVKTLVAKSGNLEKKYRIKSST